jgi:hypothetical protein
MNQPQQGTPTPPGRERAYAEWFAWAKQGNGEPGKAHAAARAALAAQDSGQDSSSSAAAAQLAAQDQSASSTGAGDPRLESYASWYAWSLQDLRLDRERAHVAAAAAIRAVEQGASSELAARSAMAAAGLTAGAERSTRRVWPWVVGGCGLAALVGIGLLVFVGFAAWNSIQSGSGCAPGDFPKYQDAQVVNLNTVAGTSGHRCRMAYTSHSSAEAVTNFYSETLTTGDWQTLHTDPSTGKIEFQRRSDPRTHGIVQVLGAGSSSRIELQVDSP